MKVFRIRDKNGLYSTGGQSPNFTKGGKTWSNIGHVKSHLRQFDGRFLEVYAEAEIVCVEYTEKDVESFDILDFMDDLNKQDIEENTSEYREKYLKEKRARILLLKEERKDNEAR